MSLSFKIIIIAVFCMSVSALASEPQSNIKILENRLELARGDRVDTLVELVWLYRNNKTEQAMIYGAEALQLLLASPEPKLQAKVLHSMAWAQMREGNYIAANELAVSALDLSKSHSLEEEKSFSLNVLGAIDWYKGDFLGALDYFLMTLNIRLKLGNQYDIASAYNNIGSVYQEINEYEKALEYHFLSLQLKEKMDDSYSVAVSLFNISIIFQKLDNPAKEQQYLEKALAIFNDIGDKEAITSVNINLGELKLKAKDIMAAEKLFDDSLAAAKLLDNRSFIVKARLGISKVAIAKKDFQQALDIALVCLDESLELDEKTQTRDSHQVLFTIYQATNEFEKALKSYKLYISIRDKILENATEGQLAMLQHQFDKKQADSKIKILQKEKTLNQYQISQAETEKRYLFYGLLLGAFLGAIILFQLFKLYRKNKLSYKASITDSLCQCFNRYYLFNQLLSKIVDQQGAVYAILIDIDYFKAVNDEHGHSTGDLVLQDFCRKIESTLEKPSYLIRLGGEEFLVIGFKDENINPKQSAEKIKNTISESPFELPDNKSIKITCSIGVAFGKVTDENSFAELIKKSDAAMYRAKGQGRDKVVFSKR